MAFLEVNDIKKSFGKNEILKGISFDLQKGEVLSIIGSSGSGKTTLLRCINFLEFAESGTITVNGEMIYDGVVDKKIKEKDLRKKRLHFGLVFQDFNLFPQYDVLQNLTLAPSLLKMGTKEELEVGAKEIIKKVGLEDRINHYPCQLSGGQKQRVAIARALANNPKVLLCDEATSALDPTTTREVLELLKDINQKLGITIVIITHEMMVIEAICNRVAIIADSRIAEIGPVKDIFAKPSTEAGRKLVYPDGERNIEFGKNRCIRIVFDGRSSFEPVIANMILDCKEPVNIIYANTKNINGTATGEMVIQLSDDEKAYDKVFAYLKARNLSVEEVKNYV